MLSIKIKNIIIFLLLTSTSFIANAAKYPMGQLSEDVIPSAYDLKLNIDPSKESFSGVVKIDLTIKKTLNFFWMHGNDLEVKSVIFESEDGQSLKADYKQVSADGVVKISLPKRVKAQNAILSIEYETKLTNELSGLYKVVVDKIPYAFTQFEPIAARRCFPSFDEPRFKTPFNVELTIPKDTVAVANTLVKSETINADEQKVVTFATTKPLPTYLVAFAVGPFDIVNGKALAASSVRKNVVPFRAVAVKGMGAKLKYALQETPRLVELLENYFQIAYPYEKLDIIAVPDFAAGAMENAGAITFRDQYIIIDAKTASVSQKRSFASIMAHELAHQWFGNLVTMKWWDDLWLNEAFATWMSYNIVADYNPEYKAEMSMLDWIHDAMRADSLVTARQIKQPILSYHDIHNAFDSITYAKGASVLTMFENYLGKSVFQASVQHHLNKFAFKTATADDFIESLTTVSQKKVREAFLSFIAQPGVPWVKSTVAQKGENSTLKLSQSRYFPVGSVGNSKKSWQIPVCYKYGLENEIKESCELINSANAKLNLNLNNPDWIIYNSNAAGYYEWSLPVKDLQNLSNKYLLKLNEKEQFALINNIQSGFTKGDLDSGTVFDLFSAFSQNNSRYVATAPVYTLNFAEEYLVPESLIPEFRKYVSELYSPMYKNLLLKNATDLGKDESVLYENKLKKLLAVIAKDQKIREELTKHGADFVKDLQRKVLNKNTELAMLSVPIWAEETPNSPLILQKLLVSNSDPMQRIILLKAIGQGAALQDAQIIYDL
ncbi:MAG: M1 family metallopeptidase, partial [bacterium]|nr:M1 family metallopeptidase [bacterium]